MSSLQKVVKQAWVSRKEGQSYFVSSRKWIFPHTWRISSLMWVKFDIEHLHAVSLSRCEFVKICAFKSILYFRAWIKFCLHFLHFSFDVGRVLCRSWLIDWLIDWLIESSLKIVTFHTCLDMVKLGIRVLT